MSQPEHDLIRISRGHHFHEWGDDDRCSTCGAAALYTRAQQDAWRARAAAGFPPPTPEELARRDAARAKEEARADAMWGARELMFPTGSVWDKCIPEAP